MQSVDNLFAIERWILLSSLLGVYAYLTAGRKYVLINPRCMRKGYSSRFGCLCVCVCYWTSCCIPHSYVKSQMSLGFLCWYQHMYCVDFVKNALFESYGDIYWSLQPSSLLDQLLMGKRDSNGFFSRRFYVGLAIVLITWLTHHWSL